MSRIGKQPIVIPAKVKVEVKGQHVHVDVTGGVRRSHTAVRILSTDPGKVSSLLTSVRVPARGAFDIKISLVGRGERLQLHCGAAS